MGASKHTEFVSNSESELAAVWSWEGKVSHKFSQLSLSPGELCHLWGARAEAQQSCNGTL